MAEEGGVSWWNSPRNLFSSSPCSLGSNDIGSFGWPSHDVITETKSVRSSDESEGSSSIVVQDVHKPDHHQPPPADAIESTLHMMGVGLLPPDGWNQDLLGRSEENYSKFLLDSSMNYRPQMNSKNFSEEDSSTKQSFGVEQQPLESLSSSAESYSYASSLLQTLFDTDSQPHPSLLDHQTSMSNYSSSAYQMNSNGFLPKASPTANLLWINASLSNVRPPPSPPSHLFQSSLSNHNPNIHSIGAKIQQQHEQGKDLATVVKKASNEPTFKRPRIETPSPLPTFKVRKEKLGDRITALQQLVSPFGKTDTASVLHEAIEYIKFLHDQVNALSTPYLKYGPQAGERNKDEEGVTKDLRTRGLCLVPISSTFPVAAQTSSDFWTPTIFGGSFR